MEGVPGAPLGVRREGLLSEWGCVCEHVCVRARVSERDGEGRGWIRGLKGFMVLFSLPEGSFLGVSCH